MPETAPGIQMSKRPGSGNERKAPPKTLIDAYPDNIVVRYLPTTASQLLRTLLAIFAFLFVSYKSCTIWNTGSVCSSRTQYLAFGVEFGLVALSAYTYYLKRKLNRQGRRSGADDV
ncbi:hypothetical protein Q7P37_002360 [Cladosporium fusiforme]